ncbi:hypothetical protein [Longitalea arenae]|uniref:hypothetical protein n=1 Tax=Longitalea arenae TaxID=2812558 RepID=UPI001967595A|nr:hypothetical protein [Longitalea arenae]
MINITLSGNREIQWKTANRQPATAQLVTGNRQLVTGNRPTGNWQPATGNRHQATALFFTNLTLL